MRSTYIFGLKVKLSNETIETAYRASSYGRLSESVLAMIDPKGKNELALWEQYELLLDLDIRKSLELLDPKDTKTIVDNLKELRRDNEQFNEILENVLTAEVDL